MRWVNSITSLFHEYEVVVSGKSPRIFNRLPTGRQLFPNTISSKPIDRAAGRVKPLQRPNSGKVFAVHSDTTFIIGLSVLLCSITR
jgi:hypothetical protein